MQYRFYIFILFLQFFVFQVFSAQYEMAKRYKSDILNSAWEAFENNQYEKAISKQLLVLDIIDSQGEEEFDYEEWLKSLSDLTLFLSNVEELDTVIKRASLVSQFMIEHNLGNTSLYHINNARLGFYYCLKEKYDLADSLLNKDLDSKSLSFTPIQQLEISAYRVAFVLCKLQSIRSLDYDYKEYEKIKKNYISEAKDIINNGLSISRDNNLLNNIFNRYLLSMKERILIREIPAFIFTPYSDIETNFKLINNTETTGSYMYKEYYNSILRYLEDGQLMESLKFLEPLVQVAIECRGNTATASTLFCLISDSYLKLCNFPKALENLCLAKEIDKKLDSEAYQDPSYYQNKIAIIQREIDIYEDLKLKNPLYAFERALMNQGSINAQDLKFLHDRDIDYESDAIGNYLSFDHNEYDFDALINELAKVYGNHSSIDGTEFQILSDYKVNPYIQLTVSLIHELRIDDVIYYKELRNYSPTLLEAKKIILDKIRKSRDQQEKSNFYHYLARYYFYINDFEEAVKAQRTHLDLEKQLSLNEYSERVLNAQKTLSLLSMAAMWNSLNEADKKNANKFQKLFIEIGEEYIKSVEEYVKGTFSELSLNNQKSIWTPLSNWFYNTTPYMGMSGRAAECIYNSAVFSKGLLLSAANGKIPELNWLDIQKRLKDDDMAIEYINFRNIHGHEIYYAVYITKECDFPKIVPLFSDFEFENLEYDKGNMYNEPIIYDLIMRPLDIPANIKNIYFSPTGILHTIAIENLINAEGDRVTDKWNMYRVSSTREILPEYSKSNYNSDSFITLIYGDLDYECNIDKKIVVENETTKILKRYKRGSRGPVEPLQFSKAEIDSIALLTGYHKIPTTIVRGENGTEESFKILTSNPVGIIHFSTHGFYYSDKKIEEYSLEDKDSYSFLFKDKDLDPEDLAMTRSALVMSGGNNILRGREIPEGREDGLLTALEITDLNLNDCELVSLSACETALGKVSNEGVFGLQRGFKIAGVQSILMSLWEVDDEATQILMTNFYKNYLKGMSKQESLLNAQKIVRETPGFSDPEYWAAFILLDALN